MQRAPERARQSFRRLAGIGGARRWRAADGGPSWQRPAAEESPLSGKHGVGREPDRRESERRSRNDTARWDGEDGASEDPSGNGETAASPGASPERRDEEFPRPSRRARSRMLPETERGLLPRPGRLVRKLGGRRPKNTRFWAGNPGACGLRLISTTLSPTLFDARFGPPPNSESTHSGPREIPGTPFFRLSFEQDLSSERWLRGREIHMRREDARSNAMATTSASPPNGENRFPRGRLLSEIRMTAEEARDLRARLASFAREWDDPRMDVYDSES